MKMVQDGVEVLCLPNDAHCMKDEGLRSPLELVECPLSEAVCSGGCFYYCEEKFVEDGSMFSDALRAPGKELF